EGPRTSAQAHRSGRPATARRPVMSTLVQIGLSNALLATALALVIWPIAARLKNPQISLLLWLLVVAKLLAPPLVSLPIEKWRGRVAEIASAWRQSMPDVTDHWVSDRADWVQRHEASTPSIEDGTRQGSSVSHSDNTDDVTIEQGGDRQNLPVARKAFGGA